MANLTNADRNTINENNLAAATYYYNPVIANGGTQSDGIYLAGYNVIGLILPTMTGATVTVEVSLDGSTWSTLNGVSVTAAVEAFEFSTGTIYGWTYVRFVSASAEAAERTLTVLVKQV